LLETPFARGAVSGIGVITVVAGLAEVAGVLSLRHRANQDVGARS
jgi:hypothetical protein